MGVCVFHTFLEICDGGNHAIGKYSFISSFPISLPFISLCCLSSMTRNSNMVLNSSERADTFVLSSIIERKQSFTIKESVSCRDFFFSWFSLRSSNQFLVCWEFLSMDIGFLLCDFFPVNYHHAIFLLYFLSL